MTLWSVGVMVGDDARIKEQITGIHRRFVLQYARLMERDNSDEDDDLITNARAQIDYLRCNSKTPQRLHSQYVAYFKYFQNKTVKLIGLSKYT